MKTDEIIKYVLCDVRREDNDVIEFWDKLPSYEEMDYRTKVDLYHKLSEKRPDAERRQFALESYLNYPFTKDNDDYSICDDYIFYVSQNSKIKITADLLTGSKEIIECADTIRNNCNDEQEKLLDNMISIFCSVIYTRGNCCPILKNKGGRKGKIGGIETCWYKIGKFIDVDKTYVGLSSVTCNNLRRRTANDMFAVFPKNVKGREIVEGLLLRDYYDKNYVLLGLGKPNNISKAEDYIFFLSLCVKLIVQRGVRIYFQFTDREFDDEKKKIIKQIFEKIGLPYDNKDKKTYLMTYEMEMHKF